MADDAVSLAGPGLGAVVAVSGGLGATLRYLVERALAHLHRLPLGTLAVNLGGSFVLGLVTGLALHHGLSPAWRAALGVGFCGGLTTWSTASFETLRLAELGAWRLAALNAIGGLATCCGLGALGLFVAS